MKKKNNTPFVLGLIGGIFGILAGILVMVFSGLVALSGAVDIDGTFLGGIAFFVMSLVAIGCGILGIVGAVHARNYSKSGGVMLLVAAILGTISISWGYVIAGPLMLLAAIITFCSENRK